MIEFFKSIFACRTYQLWLYGFTMFFIGGRYWFLAAILFIILIVSRITDPVNNDES